MILRGGTDVACFSLFRRTVPSPPLPQLNHAAPHPSSHTRSSQQKKPLVLLRICAIKKAEAVEAEEAASETTQAGASVDRHVRLRDKEEVLLEQQQEAAEEVAEDAAISARSFASSAVNMATLPTSVRIKIDLVIAVVWRGGRGAERGDRRAGRGQDSVNCKRIPNDVVCALRLGLRCYGGHVAHHTS